MNQNRRDKTITKEKISAAVSEIIYTIGDGTTIITVQNA
jgi:hypothetical protein